MKLLNLILAASAGILVAPAVNAADAQKSNPITDKEILDPSPNDWLMWRRTVDNQSFSPLKQVTTENVKSLQMKWSWALPDTGLQEMAPLVHDGVMYLGINRGIVQALDATTGDLLWEHRQALPEFKGGYQASQQDRQRNNIALYKDKVYLTTPDAKIVALDAKTGKVVWEVQAHDWEKGFSYTAGPLVINGKIFTGISGCSITGTAGGCFITAHDAETGKELWRLNTLSSDVDPAIDKTWGGLPRENRYGGSPWITGAYDAKRNMLYWGVGMPAPWSEQLRGSGDGSALYTNSTLAIDADTGAVKWYYQHLPRDDWDLDSPFERVLVNSEIAPKAADVKFLAKDVKPGQKYDVIVTVPGKYGTTFVLDRDTGKLLWARDTAYQNVIKGYTDDGHAITNDALIAKKLDDAPLICGGRGLGKLWMAGAYSPLNNTFYVPLSESCRTITPRPTEMREGEIIGMQSSGKSQYAPGEDSTGRIYAVDVKTGKITWVRKQKPIFSSSLLATAGGLVFGGDSAREFSAFDQKTGKTLWTIKLNTTIGGHPTTYSVNGKQYIAVPTGPNAQTAAAAAIDPELKKITEGGNSLFIFALP